MTVRIYNTLTQRNDEIKGRGLDPKHLNMYVCGPTVYDSPHIGHARSYIFFDTLRRVLLLDSYTVHYIQNFSDVDEKIDLRATRENVVPSVISERYKDEFLEDMDCLNVLRSDVYTSASHIKEFMHKVTEILMQQGVCYRAGDNVYFDASTGGGFGSLLHDRLENLISGTEADSYPFEKKDKEDFAIWLGDFKPESFINSEGKPSWNLECFCIVHRQVGCELDIQGGGVDLIFPHHEVSSVLSKSYCGVEFANYYIHNAFVTSKNDKMSKSMQNYVGTRELLKKHEPDAIRLYLLSEHFRRNIEFDESSLSKWDERAKSVLTLFQKNGILEEGVESQMLQSQTESEPVVAFMDLLRDDMHTENAVESFVVHAQGYPGNGINPADLRLMATALGLFGLKPAAPGVQN